MAATLDNVINQLRCAGTNYKSPKERNLAWSTRLFNFQIFTKEAEFAELLKGLKPYNNELTVLTLVRRIISSIPPSSELYKVVVKAIVQLECVVNCYSPTNDAFAKFKPAENSVKQGLLFDIIWYGLSVSALNPLAAVELAIHRLPRENVIAYGAL